MTQEEIIKQLQDRINEQSAENEELRSELSTAEKELERYRDFFDDVENLVYKFNK